MRPAEDPSAWVKRANRKKTRSEFLVARALIYMDNASGPWLFVQNGPVMSIDVRDGRHGSIGKMKGACPFKSIDEKKPMAKSISLIGQFELCCGQ